MIGTWTKRMSSLRDIGSLLCPQWHQGRDVQMLASQSPRFWSQMLRASGRMLVSESHAFLLTHLLCFLLCSFMPMVCTFWLCSFWIYSEVALQSVFRFPPKWLIHILERALEVLRKEFHVNNAFKYCNLPKAVIRLDDVEFIDDFWHWRKPCLRTKIHTAFRGLCCWCVG